MLAPYYIGIGALVAALVFFVVSVIVHDEHKAKRHKETTPPETEPRNDDTLPPQHFTINTKDH
jgi:hypothetical protein